MPLDVTPWFDDADLAERTLSELARGLTGSQILAIAGEVRVLAAQGREICDLTVGDFAPSCFPIPSLLRDRIVTELEAGQTNYPPANGIPELREAIRVFYERELGLSYPAGCVQVGSGARPPIFSAFYTLVGPGDTVVYQVPGWNVGYYVYLTGARGVALQARPEAGFLLEVDQILPHLSEANLLVLNSPLNPSGTVFDRATLLAICEAIVDENRRRREAGRRPLMLLYDQVYWQLTYGDARHYTPVELVPEMAAYTILVDAISKSWAATGLRVGWAVVPPWVAAKMKALVGHMGAWAARPEQRAVASILREPGAIDDFVAEFKTGLQARLNRLHDGFQSMKADGIPVDSLEPQGAIYLTVRFDLIGKEVRGRTLRSDDDVRRMLLEEAGVAVVPFTAFGFEEGSGWARLSVGAVTVEAVEAALVRLRDVLAH